MSTSVSAVGVALLAVIICIQGHAHCSIFIKALQVHNAAKQSQPSAPALPCLCPAMEQLLALAGNPAVVLGDFPQ